MDQTPLAALSVANRIRDQIFPSSSAFFLAGSVIREEATAYSDLDLVVVFERVESAERQSFFFEGWPVEAFIHDVETLEYFFRKVDHPSGVPSLPNMINEGIELPQKTNFGRLVKHMAIEVLEEGPEPWSQQERENLRYAISDMVEDIRDPRNSSELRIVIAGLYAAIAEYFLRSKNLWSAKGKSIPRRLMSVDPKFHKNFSDAFETAFVNEDTSPVIQLCEGLLEPDGGFLFEGYIRKAPKEWRMPAP